MKKVLELAEIKPLLHAPELIREIEAGFVLYSQEKTNVPPVGFLHFEQPPGDVHIKYGSINADDVYVVKIASAFTANPELGLPANDGMMLVFSQKTGQLQRVLLDQGWLTDMRTAAAGAVAAKHLAPSRVQQIGIVGTGVQARLQLELLHGVADCDRCVVWGRSEAKVDAMLEELRRQPAFEDWGIELRAAKSLEQLTRSSQLIVTTTAARQPLIQASWVQPGTHLTAMGSDDHGKQELEATLLGQADRVVADSVSQCVDHGECTAAVGQGHLEEGSILELGAVIDNPRLGRTADSQITVADLTGVAIQDIQIAKMVDRAFGDA